MIKILFVCHGNICRSPMAEFVMRDMVRKAGLENAFYIASAATSTEEIGNPVHWGTREKLKSVGISTAGKTAVQMKKRDSADYDLLIGMDWADMRSMYQICGGDFADKMHLLLDFTDHSSERTEREYDYDVERFRQGVKDGCRGLLQRVSHKKTEL